MTFLQGTVSELEFFTKEVLPIVKSINDGGRQALEILKEYSPLLSRQNKDKPYELYLRCRDAATRLTDLVNGNKTIRVVTEEVIKSQLLKVPDVVKQAYTLKSSELDETVAEDIRAWVEVMDLPISMIHKYDDYVNQN